MQPSPGALLQGPGPAPLAASPGGEGQRQQEQRRGEKELFEKFWRGTFQAVARPRPGSVMATSITPRRLATPTETTDGQSLPQTDRGTAEAQDQSIKRVEEVERNGCGRRKGHKHRGHRRVRSPSSDQLLPSRPSAKRKKRKRRSERRRRRERSPSNSLSPPRKKKKKGKKKSSKKSKRHRYSSKKSKHSSSTLRHKRKEERKHKKSSRGRPPHRRRHRRPRSESRGSSWCSSGESRHHLREVEERDVGRVELDQRELVWRPAVKSVCKTAPQYVSGYGTSTILPLQFGDKLLRAEGNHGRHDYDSGNDTSSPPSNKNSASQPSGVADSSSHCQDPASPDKLKTTERDNTSDSGNSVTSYASPCDPLDEYSVSSTCFDGTSKELSEEEEDVRPQRRKRSTLKRRRSSHQRRRRRSASRSPSRSASSRRSRASSRCHSPSSCSSYSRSPSYSHTRRRRGSVASTSYSRYTPDSSRERRRSTSYKESDPSRRHKEGRRKSRRKSYSPMRKRRRDSPSHLEARRITSARKRPIPYFRPSPSSSCRCSSVSSWSSIFTRSRSRTPDHTYRSNSRSSSWNSIFGTRSVRSRSPSYKRSKRSSKTRR